MGRQETISLIESMKTGILVVLLFTACQIYTVVISVKNTVETIEQTFIDQAEVLAGQGVDYVKEEYSQHAKDLVQESVDSLSNRLRNVIKIPQNESDSKRD